MPSLVRLQICSERDIVVSDTGEDSHSSLVIVKEEPTIHRGQRHRHGLAFLTCTMIVDGAPASMTRGQGVNSRFSTTVRHWGRLGTVIQTVFSFGLFFLFPVKKKKKALADQSPPSSRVDFFSALVAAC